MSATRKRFLQVKAELSSDLQTVYVTVLKQSHKGNSFGKHGRFNINVIEGSNNRKVSLFSYNHYIDGEPPSPDSFFELGYGAILFTFFVNGVSAIDKCKKVPVPIRHWPNVKAAIIAYNAQDENKK